jgi:hypothetical protein
LIKFKRDSAKNSKEPFKKTYNNSIGVVNRVVATNMIILKNLIQDNQSGVFGFYGTWDSKDIQRKSKDGVSRRYNVWRGWCAEYFSEDHLDYSGKDIFNHLYFKLKSNEFEMWNEEISGVLVECHGDYTEQLKIPISTIFLN